VSAQLGGIAFLLPYKYRRNRPVKMPSSVATLDMHSVSSLADTDAVVRPYLDCKIWIDRACLLDVMNITRDNKTNGIVCAKVHRLTDVKAAWMTMDPDSVPGLPSTEAGGHPI
jgi:hypothetical protein